MSKHDYIFEGMTCKCGNNSGGSGFHPCNDEGAIIEPTDKAGWKGLYLCLDCSKIYQDFPRIEVELIGQDGNAFFMIGRVRKELQRAGLSEVADLFQEEAENAGSYSDFLIVVDKFVDIV